MNGTLKAINFFVCILGGWICYGIMKIIFQLNDIIILLEGIGK